MAQKDVLLVRTALVPVVIVIIVYTPSIKALNLTKFTKWEVKKKKTPGECNFGPSVHKSPIALQFSPKLSLGLLVWNLGMIRHFSFAQCAICILLLSFFWRRSEQSIPEANHRQPEDWLCYWIEALLQSGRGCRWRQITAGEFQEKGQTQRKELQRKWKQTSDLPIGNLSFFQLVIRILLLAIEIKALHSDYS